MLSFWVGKVVFHLELNRIGIPLVNSCMLFLNAIDFLQSASLSMSIAKGQWLLMAF